MQFKVAGARWRRAECFDCDLPRTDEARMFVIMPPRDGVQVPLASVSRGINSLRLGTLRFNFLSLCCYVQALVERVNSSPSRTPALSGSKYVYRTTIERVQELAVYRGRLKAAPRIRCVCA